jgi:hypothetical protein
MYLFKRDDDGTDLYVGFETMMEMDATGKITTTVDGQEVTATRVRQSSKAMPVERPTVPPKTVSYNLGITGHQLQEELARNEIHNIRGVEFIPDPEVPQFCNAHFDSPESMRAYTKHLGLVDKNSRNGGHNGMSQAEFDEAEEMVLRRYPKKTGH